jgi:hypothetical protein
VQRCFEGSRTESAPTLSLLDDLLLKQITPALDAPPNQEPSENRTREGTALRQTN